MASTVPTLPAADSQAVLNEFKKRLAIDLNTILIDHHMKLQKQLNDWVSHQDSVLDGVVRECTSERDASPTAAASRAGFQGASRQVGFSDEKGRPAEAEDSGAEGEFDERRLTQSERALLRPSTFSEYMKARRRQAMVTASVRRCSRKAVLPRGQCSSRLLSAAAERCHLSTKAFMGSAISTHIFSTAILVSVLTIGVEVEDVDPGTTEVAGVVQNVCNIVFVVELALRFFVAGGVEFFTGKDTPWNVFDLLLVAISVAEMVLGSLSSAMLQDTLENILMFRIVRVIRALRIIRMVRLVRFFRPLRLLVHSIGATLKSLACAVLLLAAIMYAFGVVFTQAVKEEGPKAPVPAQLQEYFGSVLRSMLTLFQSVTSGVSWEAVFRPLHALHWSYGCFFLLYIMFASFAVLNVMTGQFCQSAIESAKKDDDEVIVEQLANKTYYIRKLKMLFESLIEDIEDGITLRSFEETMNDEHVVAYFHALDIKIFDAWTLFKLLDEDNDNIIDLDMFIEGCLHLKGPASAINLQDLACEVHWFAKHFDRKFLQLAKAQVKIKKDVNALTEGADTWDSVGAVRLFHPRSCPPSRAPLTSL